MAGTRSTGEQPDEQTGEQTGELSVMHEETLPDTDAVARRAAGVIAESAREAVAARGRFLLATSGGSTPWLMLRYLAHEDVPWSKVSLFQVDERIAPAGHADRNLTHLERSLLAELPEPPGGVYPMPVEIDQSALAARLYDDTVGLVAGDPSIFDLIHLGLGEDGHTASLLRGDPVLDVDDVDVAVSGLYHGRLRLTLTYPVLNRARRLLWVVTGAAKAPMLARLRLGDRTIPAGRVCAGRALILSDRAASPHT